MSKRSTKTTRALPDTEELFRAFFAAYEVRGFSVKILERDLALLRSFLIWAESLGCTHPCEVTPALLHNYQDFLKHQPGWHGCLKPITIRYRLNRIKRFYRWLTRRGFLKANPFEHLTLPKVPGLCTRQGLSREEVQRVLALPDLDTLNGVRVRAILETFYSTGLRQRELAQLMQHDLNPGAGLVTVREGKGRKDRVVPIGASALYYIDRYLAEVRPLILKPPDQGNLFLSWQGKPFGDYNALSSLVRRYYNRAGIKKEGACHLFRHSAATHMLQAGADIRYIQTFLGHAQLETTAIYTQMECSELREALIRCHPGECSEREP